MSQDLVFVYPSVFCAGRIAVLDRVLIHHRVNRLASVSNSRSKTPEASYQALKLVEACLEERGLMEIYRQSFLNWAMEFLVWHVCSIGGPGGPAAVFPGPAPELAPGTAL